MDNNSGAVFTIGESYPVAPPEKKFPLKIVLIVAGIVVGLGAIGLVIWMLVSGGGEAKKEDATAALNESVEAVTFLDDRLSMVNGGGATIVDIFAEGVFGAVEGNMAKLESACDAICKKNSIQGLNGGNEELFVLVRTGIEQRAELYEKYYMTNYAEFYNAFATSVQGIVTTKYTYKRSDVISSLMNSGDKTVADLAKGLDNFLSSASDIFAEMSAAGCVMGSASTATCSELNSRLAIQTEYMEDTSTVQKIFFRGEDPYSGITEKFIGNKMLELAQSLEVDGKGIVQGEAENEESED